MTKIKRSTGAIHRQQAAILSAPDFPEHEQDIRAQFTAAVEQAATNGQMATTYNNLPEQVKQVFSFTTFKRNLKRLTNA